MSNGAGIKVFAANCETRHRLSEQVRAAIREMYERSAEVEQARRTGKALVKAASLLQSAIEECVAAERAHDEHVREHGCMDHEKAARATA